MTPRRRLPDKGHGSQSESCAKPEQIYCVFIYSVGSLGCHTFLSGKCLASVDYQIFSPVIRHLGRNIIDLVASDVIAKAVDKTEGIHGH